MRKSAGYKSLAQIVPWALLLLLLPSLAFADGTLSGWVRIHGNIYPLYPVAIELLDPFTGVAISGLRTINNPDGTYELRNIPEGSYKVYFDAYGESDEFIDELSGNFQCDNGACDRVKLGTLVHVDSGTTTLKTSLTDGAMIRGKVTDVQSRPLAGVTLEFYNHAGEPYCCSRVTDEKGEWERPVLIFSTYYAVARFAEPSPYQPQAFEHKPCSGCDVGATGSPIYVENGRSKIDFRLPLVQAPASVARESVHSQKFSGSWFVPERSGEGFIVEVLDQEGPNGEEQSIVVFWFTYTPDGRQAWMVGSGGISSGVANVDFEITDGASFGTGFDPEDVDRKNWGSIRFEFLNCSRAQAEYAGEFGSGQLTLTRLSAIHGLDCTDGNDAVVSGNQVVSGAWFNPSRNGEGLIVETVGDSQIVSYWFTYDTEGHQMWMLGVGELSDGTGNLTASVPMESTSGGRFGDAFDPESIELETWGVVNFRFTECNAAEFDWLAPAPYHAGAFNLARLTALKNISCPEVP